MLVLISLLSGAAFATDPQPDPDPAHRRARGTVIELAAPTHRVVYSHQDLVDAVAAAQATRRSTPRLDWFRSFAEPAPGLCMVPGSTGLGRTHTLQGASLAEVSWHLDGVEIMVHPGAVGPGRPR